MNFSDGVLKNDERALYKLRELYSQYGYSRYKVSKFEEYDLYAHNKSFLISENILTFTDTNGKLMALKPDVTLSIVKNISGDDASTHKVYYNETVYRTSAGSDGFREIMQTGLECIGRLDLYSTCEVLMLAQKSLALIANDYILDISHMGFLTGLLENAGINAEDIAMILGYIGNKNTNAILSYCSSKGIAEEWAKKICKVTELYAPLAEALPLLEGYVCGEKMHEAYDELCGILSMMRTYGSAERLYLDFSMVNDMSYYNGVIFRGFLNGIPDGVLSGGRYDSLLRKMGKRSEAIGFAVYLDLLERLNTEREMFDFDVLLTYDETVATKAVIEAVEKMHAKGKTVRVHAGNTDGLRYRMHLHMTEEGTEVVKTND